MSLQCLFPCPMLKCLNVRPKMPFILEVVLNLSLEVTNELSPLFGNRCPHVFQGRPAQPVPIHGLMFLSSNFPRFGFLFIF